MAHCFRFALLDKKKQSPSTPYPQHPSLAQGGFDGLDGLHHTVTGSDPANSQGQIQHPRNLLHQLIVPVFLFAEKIQRQKNKKNNNNALFDQCLTDKSLSMQHHPHPQQAHPPPQHLHHSRPPSIVHQQHQGHHQQPATHHSGYHQPAQSLPSAYQPGGQAANAQDNLNYYSHPSPYSTPGATSGYTSAGEQGRPLFHSCTLKQIRV